jgi:hypothetical protein
MAQLKKDGSNEESSHGEIIRDACRAKLFAEDPQSYTNT